MYFINIVDGMYCVVNTFSNLIVAKFSRLVDATNYIQTAQGIPTQTPQNYGQFFGLPLTNASGSCGGHDHNHNRDYSNNQNSNNFNGSSNFDSSSIEKQIRELSKKIDWVLEDKKEVMEEIGILKSILTNSRNITSRREESRRNSRYEDSYDDRRDENHREDKRSKRDDRYDDDYIDERRNRREDKNSNHNVRIVSEKPKGKGFKKLMIALLTITLIGGAAVGGYFGYKYFFGEKTPSTLSDSDIQSVLNGLKENEPYANEKAAEDAIKKLNFNDQASVNNVTKVSFRAADTYDVTYSINLKAKSGYSLTDSQKGPHEVALKVSVPTPIIGSVSDMSLEIGQTQDQKVTIQNKNDSVLKAESDKVSVATVTVDTSKDTLTVVAVAEGTANIKLTYGDAKEVTFKVTVTKGLEVVSTENVQKTLDEALAGNVDPFDDNSSAINFIKKIELDKGLIIDKVEVKSTRDDETENKQFTVTVKADNGYKIKENDKTSFGVIAKIKVTVNYADIEGYKDELEKHATAFAGQYYQKEAINNLLGVSGEKYGILSQNATIVSQVPEDISENYPLTVKVEFKLKNGFQLAPGDSMDFEITLIVKGTGTPKDKEVSTSGVQVALNEIAKTTFKTNNEAIDALKAVELTEGLEIDSVEEATSSEYEFADVTFTVTVKAKTGYVIKEGDDSSFSVKTKVGEEETTPEDKEVSTSGVQAVLDEIAKTTFKTNNEAIDALKAVELTEGLEIDSVKEATSSEYEIADVTFTVTVKAKTGYVIKEGDDSSFSVKTQVVEEETAPEDKEVSTSGVQAVLDEIAKTTFKTNNEAIDALKAAELTEGLEIDSVKEATSSEYEIADVTFTVTVKAKEGYKIQEGDDSSFSVKTQVGEEETAPEGGEDSIFINYIINTYKPTK
ncbi:hypothetical protein [Spiroplasma monobiae]|uniref:BIG2 domain-containing protein n=1 Tax=Spiroplasma monobiae MQ-1 TaxID=1336748 RepID=A0A2K9LUR2_SPISQ|nr:hypothetical protein [Spiroplasma monobiae]AUM62787.1 hypothetical protein SMONO_v1c05380 [Spiroplasma monobiae MQ-1]